VEHPVDARHGAADGAAIEDVGADVADVEALQRLERGSRAHSDYDLIAASDQQASDV
jgi:hypothetical protein